ncbi:MAG: hypothetical protein RLY61_403 [Candidatus Parcubacteria bacterium]
MKKETATESVILTAEELDFIKKGAAEFTKIKTSLGELELQKQGLLKKAEEIAQAFTHNEKILIEKYGVDAVINMQTGEVTQKPKDNDTK